MLKTSDPPSVWIILISVFVIGVLSLLAPMLTWKRQSPPNEDAWHGIFYWNPADPSLFVPKRFGIGYTLNFANPWCWVVLVGILTMVAVPVIFAGVKAHSR